MITPVRALLHRHPALFGQFCRVRFEAESGEQQQVGCLRSAFGFVGDPTVGSVLAPLMSRAVSSWLTARAMELDLLVIASAAAALRVCRSVVLNVASPDGGATVVRCAYTLMLALPSLGSTGGRAQ